MGIVEFLEARIAEDEAVAQDAGARALEWRSSNGSVSGGGKPYVDDWSEDEPLTQYDGEVTIVYDEGWPEDVEAEHIARQDPARILCEVAAKRAVVVEHKLVPAKNVWGKSTGGFGCELCDSTPDLDLGGIEIERSGGCKTLRSLAVIFSDHPDFDEEWRP